MSQTGRILIQAEASAVLMRELDSRDAAVWLLNSFADAAGVVETAKLLGLPWAFVLSESSDPSLISALETSEESVDGPLVRRRGMIHVVDTNPANVTLPRRGLPIFLLNGEASAPVTGLAAITRRLTMIGELQRRSIKHLVILSGPKLPIPAEIAEIWNDGFRCLLTVVSDDPEAESKLTDLLSKLEVPSIGLVPVASETLACDLVQKYTESRDDRLILRLRDVRGAQRSIDVTGLDDPEHPLLGRYELLTENLLLPLLPEDLRAEDVESFFQDPRTSWRPFASGIAWQRDQQAGEKLKRALRRLDKEGPEANRVFFVSAESGAGATTFIRDLAWIFAAEGYPALLASLTPFMPSGLEVASFITRCLAAVTEAAGGEDTQVYEVPWLVVFDRQQWEGCEEEIVTFTREIEAAGRRACIIVATGPILPLAMYGDRRFERLTNLTHEISEVDALDLGRHLNRYLVKHGTKRQESEWRNFFRQSMVDRNPGIAAFWIVLSFWLQRQFDLSETVQGWVYRQFREKVTDPDLQRAIIDIAAMSTERQALPELLLPNSKDWPMSTKLGDLRSELGALGLVRITDELHRFWALLHDQLGRFILTGLFYDRPAREEAGLSEAQNPEHLRLLVLKHIAAHPDLALNDLRQVADSFATTIFKIDPDHGHALFAPYWREALDALDNMPRAFRTTSRTFLHHAAVSRRRITSDADTFPISKEERITLLERAVADIEMALGIEHQHGEESDINLLNSLAHAYHDLAQARTACAAPRDQVAQLRARAQDATRRAYRLNPDNSYVIETYARDLLIEAQADSEAAAGNAIEVLSLVYGSMQWGTAGSRQHVLARLADNAIDILLEVADVTSETTEPSTPGDAIVTALQCLAKGVTRFEGMELVDYPLENRRIFATRLAHPLLLSNPQAVRLRYLLACMDRQDDFALQLELLEALEESHGTFTPQMRLELAILLHQVGRHHEGARQFHGLRALWREGRYYVEVPQRLKWFAARNGQGRQQVRATIAARGDARDFARVRELQNEQVPFRSREFGQERIRPEVSLNGFISFGHNGPFLRPLTAV